VRLQADSAGGRLVPAWRWLGWLLFREIAWSWSDVQRLEEIIGPFGGVHGVRVVFTNRPVAKRGATYPWFRTSRRFVIGIVPADVEALLRIVPEGVVRPSRRSLMTWR
jgi:hypothetical protein